MEVHLVHRDVCGGPTDDHGVAAGVAVYLLVVRLCGCMPGDMAAVSSIAWAICPWRDCLIA